MAAFSASRGYKLTVFLEPGQSEERQKMLRAYGADLKSMFDVPGVPEAFANGTFTTGFYQEAIQKYCDAQPTHHYFINQLVMIPIREFIMRQPDRRSGKIQMAK